LNKKLTPISFAKKIFPLNRSLSGGGNRQTLKEIKKLCSKLIIKKFVSNKKVYDWRIPLEWNVRDAYIIDPNGKKICSFKKNNLHLVGYSYPQKKNINLNELQKHLHSIPDKPSAIPYVTTYYEKNWGFCISHKQRKKLIRGNYKVFINTELKKGALNYGEIFIKGKSNKEVFFSTYICHPSMANNETSGITVNTFLAKILSKKKTYYSYRFVFLPETIGSIAYLSKNLKKMKAKIIAGFNITCVGDERSFSLLLSKYGNTFTDFIAKKNFKILKGKKRIYSWNDRGSDERQYCSPFIDLPICSLMRSKYGEYKEYHNSLDQLGSVVTNKGLSQSIEVYKKIIEDIEKSNFPTSVKKCEPFMTKYNLYNTLKKNKFKINPRKIMDYLSWCDGKNSSEMIKEKINVSKLFEKDIFKVLLKKKLIKLF
jgi:aminopeptidase-like protein